MTKIVERADLFCKAGSKDAVYHLELTQADDGFRVNYRNGRAGGTLTPGTKTVAPLPTLEAAKKVFDKVVKEKLKSSPPYQYMEGPQDAGFTEVQAEVSERSTGLLPQLLNEIDADDTATLEAKLRDDNWVCEQKADGERRMVRSAGDGTTPTGSNRKGLAVPLPREIAESLAHVRCVIDGEIIGATLHAFDLLELYSEDLRSLPQKARKAKLHEVESLLGPGVEVMYAAVTTAEKRELLERSRALGQEGIVLKDSRAPYTEGRPNAGGPQLKVKNWAEATVIVLAGNQGKRSVTVGVIGDTGQVLEVGSVTIPANAPIPMKDSLIDVRYLYAFPDGGSLFQPVFRRARTDIDRAAASIKQLKYKQAHWDLWARTLDERRLVA